MEKRQIVAFDFDGTLTTKDTMFEFIRFVKGTWRLWAGIGWCSPVLLAYLLRLCPNSKAKQRLFSFFFKDMPYQQFRQLGEDFQARVEELRKAPVVQQLQQHLSQGDRVYVISGSIEEWVRPWCERMGVHRVLATQVEVSEDGCLTGRFSSPNCFGQEKVNRLLAEEPDRSSYHLTVYGDSRGDRELMALADEAFMIK